MNESREQGKKDFMSQVEDYIWHFKCSKVKAMQAIMRKDPESHRRYIEESNSR